MTLAFLALCTLHRTDRYLTIYHPSTYCVQQLAKVGVAGLSRKAVAGLSDGDSAVLQGMLFSFLFFLSQRARHRL